MGASPKKPGKVGENLSSDSRDKPNCRHSRTAEYAHQIQDAEQAYATDLTASFALHFSKSTDANKIIVWQNINRLGRILKSWGSQECYKQYQHRIAL